MTVVEIARQAGVSIGTVDRVLHNRGRVSAETRARILEIIQETGYQPNALARQLKRKQSYRIGLLIPELEKESRYWQLVDNGLSRAVSELSAFSFSVERFTFVRPDRASLSDAFARMVAADCTAWVIAPIMQEETLVLLSELETPVPYTFIDSPLPGASPLTTVAQEPFQGGYLAGRMMDLVASGDGTFAVILPYTEAFNLNERARGFASWFSGRPGSRIVKLVCPEPRMDEATETLERAMADYPDMRGMFAVSAIGHKIASIVSSHGWRDRVALVGYDLVAENERCLRDGTIDCILSQRPEDQGRIALFQIYRHLVYGETSAREVRMPFDVYFKENLP